MKIVFVIVLLSVVVRAAPTSSASSPAKDKRTTDQEMYTQALQFIQAHQGTGVPLDQKLVENILSSAKWAELVAQFGDKKKIIATARGAHKGKRVVNTTPSRKDRTIF